MRKPDRQRARVYAWEDAIVAPKDGTTIPFAAAQGMIDAIWAEQGLSFPPMAVRLPRQARRAIGRASRLTVELRDEVPAFVLLHELAHSLSSDQDGRSDGHGPVFLGLYLSLLERYLRLPRAMMEASLLQAGLHFEREARPVFLDRD